MLGRALRGGLTVAAVAAATVLVGTVHAPAAKAEPECLYGSYDFNRDGHVDLAAGLPGASGGSGVVEVNLSVEDGGYAPVRVRADGLQPGDAFGTAVSEFASYENEGEDVRCSQLAVGAPGRDVGGVKDAGAVFVFAFDNDGKVQLVRELVQGKDGVPGTPTAGARFGAALAGAVHPEGTGPVRTPLYVGAPGATVDGAKGAGQVVRLMFDGDGAVDGTAVASQGHGVPGTPEAGDGFGTAVAAEAYGAIIGAPGENSGAGAVAFAFSNSQEIKAKLITQNSPDVPGVSEAGDHFGQAVLRVPPTSDVDDDQILVGLPGEAIGTKAGAGSVIHFLNVLTNGTGYTQDSPGVAGTAEAGDAFGSSLAAFGGHKLVAGVPGEDVGTLKDAGAVTALSGEAWDQNTAGVADTAEAGDRFGATLADLSYEGNDVPPLVGVPGENGGAGLVQYGGSGFAGKAWTATGAAAGDHFGAAVGRTD